MIVILCLHEREDFYFERTRQRKWTWDLEPNANLLGCWLGVDREMRRIKISISEKYRRTVPFGSAASKYANNMSFSFQK